MFDNIVVTDAEYEDAHLLYMQDNSIFDTDDVVRLIALARRAEVADTQIRSGDWIVYGPRVYHVTGVVGDNLAYTHVGGQIGSKLWRKALSNELPVGAQNGDRIR